MFGCDKYRSTLFNKIIIKNMKREREHESGKKVVVFKNFKDKIIIKWKESDC